MSHKLCDTSGQRLRLAMWPTHALLATLPIVQYAACLYATLIEVFATRTNVVRRCAVSLLSVHLFVFSAALTQCLYFVHNVARVVQSFACFALQSLRYFLCIQKSVLHFSVTLAMYSNVGSMHFTMFHYKCY